MNLKKIIANIEDTPLTTNDLLKINYKVKVNTIYYSDIYKYKSIDNLFQKNEAIIILIDRKDNSIGHFVCLLKKNNTIEFFDPYGKSLEEIIYIMNINDNSLLKLLFKSDYEIIYNKYKYESTAPKIESCGIQCASRIFHFNLSNKEYYEFLKYKNLKPDEIVALLFYVSLN